MGLDDLRGEPYLDRLACETREQVAAAGAARGIALYATDSTDREDWVQRLVQAGLSFAFLLERSVLLAVQSSTVEPWIVCGAGELRSAPRPAKRRIMAYASRFTISSLRA